MPRSRVRVAHCRPRVGRLRRQYPPKGSEEISDSFANGQRGDRFTGLASRVEATGSPVLEEALAWLDCRVTESHSAGDHVIVVGRIEACGASRGQPLVFHGGRYRAVVEGYRDVPEE